MATLSSCQADQMSEIEPNHVIRWFETPGGTQDMRHNLDGRAIERTFTRGHQRGGLQEALTKADNRSSLEGADLSTTLEKAAAFRSDGNLSWQSYKSGRGCDRSHSYRCF